jgi:hypothetical protein
MAEVPTLDVASRSKTSLFVALDDVVQVGLSAPESLDWYAQELSKRLSISTE